MAYPWAEMKREDINTIVDRVQCVICTAISGRLVAMKPKPNMLDKHLGKWQAKIDLSYIGIKNKYYINKKMPPLEGNSWRGHWQKS